jgi:AcrR family transcriptional regulator
MSPSQTERSEATRTKLLRAGRELFAKQGFASVGTEEIVRRAKVTRGALYHHFSDKRALFRAVHEALEAELAEQIGAELAAAASDAQDPLEALAVGVRAFLDACVDPAIARIALIDAPSVLGWAEWREIDERYGLGLVIAALELGIEAGRIRPQPVRPLAHLLLAAMGEAGMVVANAPDPAAARAEVEPALLALLEGLSEHPPDKLET